MIKQILNNPILRVFSFNSIIVIGKVFSSFVVSKVSAIYLGPTGFAIVGNFKNVLQGILGITSSGFQSGVIRHIAENKNNKQQSSLIITSVFALSLFLSLLIAPFIYFFSDTLSISILNESSYAFIFKYLAICLPLISFNFLLLYIINGLQKIKLFTIISIVFNALNAVLTFLLIHFFNLKGALIVSLIVPVISFLASFLFKEVRVLFSDQFFTLKKISVTIVKSISVYLFMAVYSTVLISMTYLLIRNKIIAGIDIETAGLWEGMNKISTFYMLVFTSLLTLYLLPKLAENKTICGYKSIMTDYFKFVLPLMIVLFGLVFIFRILIIRVFLTPDFLLIKDFFYLQLIGDFIKVVGFSLAYQFHAKRIIIPYFISDAILYGSFYLICVFLLDTYQLSGVYYAYICSLVLYLLTVVTFIYSTRNKYLQENVQ